MPNIFDKMREITSGKIAKKEEEVKESLKAQHGDVINGVINNVIREDKNGKGGYGFITSPALPYERIYFHWTGLKQDTLRFPEIRKRMKVEFQLQYNEFDGYKAIKISVL